MKEMNKIFYDGMESVKLVDGVIHMEFFNMVGKGNAEEKVTAAELVLSQQAFLRAYSAMENLVGQLEKAGLIKRKAPETTGTASPAPVTAAPASPNFQ